MKPKFLSVLEFCTTLGIGKTKAYELLKTEVKSARIGTRRLVLRSSVEKLVKRALEKGAD